MFKVLLALHILAAVFAIGPLVHAATTAARGLRTSDAAAIAMSSRLCKIYAGASVVVVILGFGLMSATSPYTHEKAGDFGDVWIWLSLVLWLVAAAITVGVVTPALDRAAGEPSAAAGLVGRVAASGGVVGVLFAVIIFLMVYRPGS